MSKQEKLLLLLFSLKRSGYYQIAGWDCEELIQITKNKKYEWLILALQHFQPKSNLAVQIKAEIDSILSQLDYTTIPANQDRT